MLSVEEKLNSVDVLSTEDAPFEQFIQLRSQIHCSIDYREEVEELLSNFGSVSRKLSSDNKIETRKAIAKWLIGDVEEAIPLLENTRATRERSFFLGISYLESGRANAAHANLKDAYDADTSDTTVAILLTEAKVKLGKMDEAMGLLERLKKKCDENPDYHYALGLYYDYSGNREEAEKCYEHALELDNAHSKSTFRLAYNLDLKGEEEKATELYEQLRKARPMYVEAIMNLGLLYEDNGQYQKAADCFKSVLEYYPNNDRARLYLSDAEASLNMYYDEDTVRKKEKMTNLLSIPVDDLNLSLRVKVALGKAGIHRISDLVRKNEGELLEIPSMGKIAIKEINEQLHLKGLALATTEGEVSLTSEVTGEVSEDLLNKPLSDLEWPGRVKNVFERLNIYTVGDLIKHSERDLLDNKNLGMTSIRDIRKKLELLGLAMKE